MGKMIKPVSQTFLLPVVVICNLRMQMATHLQIMLPMIGETPHAIFRPQKHLWPDRLSGQHHWPAAVSLTVTRE